MAPHTSSHSSIVRSLRIDDVHIEAILDRLDNSGKEAEVAKRKTGRYAYRVKNCVIHLQQPGAGSSIPYLVPTRDISAKGISFLHGGYVHAGSKCALQLVTTQGAWQELKGVVVRCQYIENGIHEVGFYFDSEIEPADFCKGALHHRVLLVEDDASIVRLATFLLKQLNANVDHAENGQIAIEKALRNTYDVILMDMEMPVLDGFGAMRELRNKGYSGMIVAVTALAQPTDRERCMNAGCNKYLSKPLVRQELADLLDTLHQKPLFSSFQSDPKMADIIDEFLAELPAKVRAIEDAFAAEDAERLQSLVRGLKGEAGGYGFEPITKEARIIETALIDGTPISQTKTPLDALADWCSRARSSARVAKSDDNDKE